MKLFELFNKYFPIKFYNNVIGFSHGQMDGIVYAYNPENYKKGFDPKINEGIYGFLQWASYNGDTQIQYIKVKPQYRRKGIATLMINFLKKELNEPIVWSMTTSDGEKLKKFIIKNDKKNIQEKILNELRYEFKSQNVDDKNFDIIVHRGKIWIFNSFKDNKNDALINSLIKNLHLKLDTKYIDEINLVEIIHYIGEERPDILYGNIINGKILHIDTYGIKQDPYSSKLIIDVIKIFNLDKVTTEDPETDEEIIIPRQKILGRIPDILFHGTNSRFIKNILSKGIMPVSHSNWDKIKFPNLIFLASDPEYAAYQARTQAHRLNGEIPIIIATKIPDKSKLVLDFDIAFNLYGKDHPEVKKLGYFNQNTKKLFKRRQEITKLIQKVNKGTDLNSQMGVFGYKGRIPSTMFKEFFYPPNNEMIPLNNKWIKTTNKRKVLNDIEKIKDFGFVYDEDEES